MWRFEVQFHRFLEVGKGLFLGVPLAGDVEFEALGDIPPPLAPNGSRKWSLHDLIVPQPRGLRYICVPPRSNRNPGREELPRRGLMDSDGRIPAVSEWHHPPAAIIPPDGASLLAQRLTAVGKNALDPGR